jgi:hypothetical protein
VKAWDEALADAVSQMQLPDDFLTGKLSPEDADVASYSYVSWLMSDGRRYQSLLEALRGGADFAQAFASAYGGTPNQVAGRWAARGIKKRR